MLLVGCTSNAKPPTHLGSRGPRATDHLDAAHEHDRRALDLASWPDVRRADNPTTGLWYRVFDTVVEQHRLADEHRSAAAALHADYAEACGGRSYVDVAISPLARFGLGGSNTETGVVIFLTPEAGSREQLLESLRCHRAWMMIEGMDMDDCPLDLAGIHIDAHVDTTGASVEITTKDPKLVGELQRRAARELETAAKSHPH